MNILINLSYTKIGGDNMNKANGVTELQYNRLIYAIGNVTQYRNGVFTMQKYYFPIRSLSNAIDNVDTFERDYEQDDTLIR